MATTTATPVARVRSSYLDRALERERGAVEICRYRYAAVLGDLQRELSKELRDEDRLSALLYDAMDAECALSMAKMDLEEAEEA